MDPTVHFPDQPKDAPDRSWPDRHGLLFFCALFFVCVLGALAPHLLRGQDTFMAIHNLLEANVIWAKVLAEGHYLLASNQTIVAPVLNGIPREYFGSEFNPFNALFALFPPLAALIVNEALIRSVAFVGMALLLKDHLLVRNPERVLISALVAGGFCLLPYFFPAGLSTAGAPLLAWAYLNTRDRGMTPGCVAIIVCTAAYSSIISMGMFCILILGAVGIWDIRAGRYVAARKTAIFMLIMLGASLVMEYRLYLLLATGEALKSQRTGMHPVDLSLLQSLRAMGIMFVRGVDEAWPLSAPIIISVCAAVATLPGFRAPAVAIDGDRLLKWLLAAVALISFVYGFWQYDGLQALARSAHIPYINLSRFYWLEPPLWHAAFAVALGVVAMRTDWSARKRRTLVAVAGAAQIVLGFWNLDTFAEARASGISYRQFYASALFAEIQHDIGAPPASYRVVSVGLHPTIAQYNGFYTLDGYQAIYPKSYKDVFRHIIAPELQKDEELRRYYDDWGSRAYVFSKDLKPCNFLCTRQKAPPSITLGFDERAFRGMGGRYLFSVSRIANASALHLRLIKLYDRPQQVWRLYVYGLTAN